MTKKNQAHLLQKFVTSIQSEYLLPTARTLNVIAAGLALLIVIVGLFVAFYFHTKTLETATSEPLPPPYSSPARTEVDLAIVNRRLSPPDNLRFVLENRYISRPLGELEVLGYLFADSPNDLAAFPHDFAVIGGAEAELFERVLHPGSGRTGLAARPELVAEINSALVDQSSMESRSFELRVVAYDKYGTRSEPGIIRIELAYGPPSQRVSVQENKQRPHSELEAIAQELSEIADPEGTPLKFEAYNRALQIPTECGAQNDTQFVINFRRSLEEVRERLNNGNLEAFYSGLCEAWKTVINAQQAAAAKAEAARAQVSARNREKQAEAQMVSAGAQIARSLTFSVIGGSLAVFMIIAFILSFFALEGHTLAIRKAIETLASREQSPKMDEQETADLSKHSG